MGIAINKLMGAMSSRSVAKKLPKNDDHTSCKLARELNQMIYKCDRICQPRDKKCINLNYEYKDPVRITDLATNEYKYCQLQLQ